MRTVQAKPTIETENVIGVVGACDSRRSVPGSLCRNCMPPGSRSDDGVTIMVSMHVGRDVRRL